MILEDIAGDIDGSQPNGARYDADLIDEMTTETPLRLAAIPDSDALHDLMRFRREFRNNHGDLLRRHKLLEKVQAVEERIMPGMLASLRALQNSLEAEVEGMMEKSGSDKEASADPS